MSASEPNYIASGGLLGAAADTLSLTVTGYGTVAFQLGGTWVGTVTFECKLGDETWQTLNVTKTNATSPVTSSTGNGIWTGSCAGLQQVRARASAFTSGQIRVGIVATPSGGGSGGGGGAAGGTSSAFGAAFPGDGTAAGFIDSSGNMAGGTLDASGFLKVNVAAGGGAGGTSSTFGAPMPATGTAVGFEDSGGNMAPVVLEADGSIPVTVMGAGSAVSIADGADVAEGATTDAKVLGDNTGTVSAKLRGLNTILNDVWDSVSHFLKVSIQNATLAVTQSGTWNIATVTLVSTLTAITNALPAGNNNIGDVDVASSALPSGASTLAEQQTQTASLSVLDDWDESDRAKVNLIAGQAGILGGTGVDAANVPRVSLATNVALPTGSNAIGKLAANSGVDIGDVDVTSISAGSNLIGDVGIQPRTTNGLTTMNATSSDGATALTGTAQVISAAAGKVFGWYIYNPNAIASFVQFYNTAAASVTVGTTNPLFMITVPPLAACVVMNDIGITFSNTGFSWAATSTAGGAGNPTAALDAVAFYK